MKQLLYIGNKLSHHGSTTTSIETLGSLLEIEGYKVNYASSKKNKMLRFLDMIFCTLWYSKKTDYVLIDTYSTQNFYFAVVTSQLCRILNLKYITELHGGNLPNRLKKSPFFCDLVFKNAYKITAPSDYLIKAFEAKYSENLIYIPNAIEIENYSFSKREFHSPRLLWVRSFSKIYNPKMAIDVLYNLKKNFPNASLTMVGPDKENLIEGFRKYALELDVEVNFTGKLVKEEWVSLSKDYNIFINTTHFDNAPISVIEAMALGLPVVSTNVGGIPYLLHHNKNGLLVDDCDVDAMTNSITEIFNNEIVRDRITINARKSVELFDWNSIKLKWFEILK
jgi:L-malate glycosyltransferase